MQQQLLKNIIGDIDDASSIKKKLEELVADYPYFSTPNYFLMQQTPNADTGYAAIASKTALFFPNALLLQYRLNHVNNYTKELIAEVENTSVADEATKTEQLQTEKENEPALNSLKEEMLFVPLYATDYFASQGIKLSEQVAPTDKLGMQVKSFTSWLKSMKKLPGSQLAVDANIDNTVEQLAQKSNDDAEVVTETMAEVFVSQGHKAKAREIYKKLSLLNPSKSAFFAAKIEELKSTSH